MSRMCETCGRGALSAQTRSHAKNATKTRKLVNLQTKRMKGVSYRLCTRCLRTIIKNPDHLERAGKVERVISTRDKRKATK